MAVELTPDAAALNLGDSVRFVLTVTTTPGGGTYAVAWTTSDASAASVDSTGLVIALAQSPSVSICATASLGHGSSSMKSCAVVLLQFPRCVEPDSPLIPANGWLHVGDVQQYQIPPAQMAGRSAGEIRWSVIQPATARIDSLTGVLTAVGVGTADIVAIDQLYSSPCPHEWRAVVVVVQ
jgi:uncharacterized protein YjdB